jgi:hypothetical protein
MVVFLTSLAAITKDCALDNRSRFSVQQQQQQQQQHIGT